MIRLVARTRLKSFRAVLFPLGMVVASVWLCFVAVDGQAAYVNLFYPSFLSFVYLPLLVLNYHSLSGIAGNLYYRVRMPKRNAWRCHFLTVLLVEVLAAAVFSIFIRFLLLFVWFKSVFAPFFLFKSLVLCFCMSCFFLLLLFLLEQLLGRKMAYLLVFLYICFDFFSMLWLDRFSLIQRSVLYTGRFDDHRYALQSSFTILLCTAVVCIACLLVPQKDIIDGKFEK